MDEVFEIPEHLLEKGVSLKTSKNKPKSSFDNTFVKSVDSKKDYNDTKNGKKKVEKETIEKADMYEQMKTMIKQQLEEEEKNKKRKYDRKKPTSEKTVSEEYKQKLRDNMARAREKRLLQKGVSPKNTFSEKVLSKTEEKPKEIIVEKPKEIIVEKPKEVIIEKPKEIIVEKPKEIIVEKPKEVIIEKPQVIKFSTIKRPPWFMM